MTPPADPRPPFDPEIEAALDDERNVVVTSLEPEEIEPLRHRSAASDEPDATRDGSYRMSWHTVPGSPGVPDVRVATWRPVGAVGPLPLLLHLHGGGLVVGTVLDDACAFLDLAADTGSMLASVDYRLAPEAPYPAALEDAYAALTWLVATAEDHGIDPERVVVTGVSAGGGLAAATALLARDRGGPALAGQMLVCPMLDDRNDSASARQMAGVGAWDRTANRTGWQAYLGERAGGPDVPIYAAPGRADDLSGLPPTFIDVGSAETFRDEDSAYAARLWRAGGAAELHVWAGGCHGFDFLAPAAAVSRDAREARRRWLARLLRPRGEIMGLSLTSAGCGVGTEEGSRG